jgi:hypothetical protein
MVGNPDIGRISPEKSDCAMKCVKRGERVSRVPTPPISNLSATALLSGRIAALALLTASDIMVAGASPRLQTRRVHMVNASDPKERRSARIAIVEQHICLENDHDLEGVLRTFGETARYDDEPWGEHYTGRDGSVCFTSS